MAVDEKEFKAIVRGLVINVHLDNILALSNVGTFRKTYGQFAALFVFDPRDIPVFLTVHRDRLLGYALWIAFGSVGCFVDG